MEEEYGSEVLDYLLAFVVSLFAPIVIVAVLGFASFESLVFSFLAASIFLGIVEGIVSSGLVPKIIDSCLAYAVIFHYLNLATLSLRGVHIDIAPLLVFEKHAGHVVSSLDMGQVSVIVLIARHRAFLRKAVSGIVEGIKRYKPAHRD